MSEDRDQGWLTTAAKYEGLSPGRCGPSPLGQGAFSRKSLSGCSLASLSMEEVAGHKGFTCRAGAEGGERTFLGMKRVGRKVCLLAYLEGLLCFCCPRNAILAAPEVGVGTEKGERCRGKVLSHD